MMTTYVIPFMIEDDEIVSVILACLVATLVSMLAIEFW